MYEDYYTRQVGGNLPFFVGARVQRGHGLGNFFGSLIRSAMPLIKRGALASSNNGHARGGRRGSRAEPETGCNTTCERSGRRTTRRSAEE